MTAQHRLALESLNALNGEEPDLKAHELMLDTFDSLPTLLAEDDVRLWSEEHAWDREFTRAALAALLAARHLRRMR